LFSEEMDEQPAGSKQLETKTAYSLSDKIQLSIQIRRKILADLLLNVLFL